MRRVLIFLALCLLPISLCGQATKSVTVPITLDHNRIIIDVYLPLPTGDSKRVRAWVDSGNPDLVMTENVAKLLGLPLGAETQDARGPKMRTAPAPQSLLIGGTSVSFAAAKEARVLPGRESIAPGLSAEINLPSRVLRNYDVLINYPDREFTIGPPGSVDFKGVTAKALVNADNGLVQVAAKIESKSYNLGLDVGASVGFLSGELIGQWLQVHGPWPHMTGAVGMANLWGLADEPRWQLLRLPTFQYGPLYLTDTVFAGFDATGMDWFEKRAGVKTAGLVGANALLNYRVGIDYKHETVYFDLRNFYRPADFDVVGLVLRPEVDGRYTVLAVADFEGVPSVAGVQAGDVLISSDGSRATGGTMGQAWSSLEGRPGQERKLVLSRDGKQFEVNATVKHFLAAQPETTSNKKKK
jgi:hypothetical protein